MRNLQKIILILALALCLALPTAGRADYQQLFANNIETSLSAALTAAATTLTVADATGMPEPTNNDYFLATLSKRTGSTEYSREIVKVTARSGNTLTLIRAQEGTSALEYDSGDFISLRLTTGSLETLQKPSQLIAPDGNPDPAVNVDNAGNVEISATATAADYIATAINKAVASVDAVAVYYGKVAWDDDPTWIDRTEWTSWYNETLNTATRGATRAFPAEYLIVLEEVKYTIYDATDTSLPMWRVCNAVGGAGKYWWRIGIDASDIKCINGQIVISINNEGAATDSNGVAVADYASDSLTKYSGNAAFTGSGLTISQDAEATTLLIGTTPVLVDRTTNAIALTRLPDAPINPATGMRYVTIACATDGGVSVIDGPAGVGTVKDLTHVVSVDASADHVVFYTGNTIGWGTRSSVGGGVAFQVLNSIPSVDYSGVPDRLYVNANHHLSGYGQDLTYLNGAVGGYLNGAVEGFIGNGGGVSIFDENPTTPAEGAVAYITTDYNTGMMRGDIQLATLADTTAGTVVDTELFDGTFTDVGSSWTDHGDGSFSSDGTSSTLKDYDILTYGKLYLFSIEVTSYTSGTLTFYNGASGDGFISTSSAGVSTLYIWAINDVDIVANSVDFNGTIDNISVTEAIPDRCVQENHLTVTGTLTKAAVATGAELMGWSGFGTNNYASQSYTSDLDLGAEGYWEVWLKTDDDSFDIFNFGDRGVDLSFSLYIDSGNDVRLSLSSDGTTETNCEVPLDAVITQWLCCGFTFKDGFITPYANGVQADTPVAFAGPIFSQSTAQNPLNIGADHISIKADNGITISLIKISKTAPTAEQIKADYLAELPMFQEDAACTLSGSSDSVLALDYDSTTE
ncbi:hypothetical protein KAR91_29005, partial [Candidatus Pacearchaeota archaeon]|nr:hypothetical protein [Candidatus Pacearchaeota archaeon]